MQSQFFFTGKNCSTDFDECSIPNTCLNNATCTNLVNNYTCICVGNYTGRNCEIEINYCTTEKPCLNGATCTPLGDDFVCQCLSGFTGRRCDIKTTFSFEKTGHWNIVNSAKLVSINVSFRTTVDGLLLILSSKTTSKLALYLYDGKIILKQDSNLVNYQAMKISATNGLWHQLQITFGQRISLKVDDGQLKSYSSFNFKDVNLITVGGNDKQIAPNFAGCMQDLFINGQIFLKSNGTHTEVSFGNCVKTYQCSGNPCNNHGTCVDQWISFKCNCFRQYFGERCQSGNFFFF